MRKLAMSITGKAIQGARQTVPGWEAFQAEVFACKTITGGLTNKLNLVQLEETVSGEVGCKKALVRIFGQGTDEFIDRNAEALVCAAMSGTGIAPKVYGVFPGGRSEEFIDNAQSIRNTDLHRPEILEQVAQLMAKMHSINLSSQDLTPLVKDKTMSSIMLRKLWEGAARIHFNTDITKALKLAAVQVSALAAEIEWLEEQMEQSGMGKVLCHRDLQSGNVMVQTHPEDESAVNNVYLIDFEYSGLDYCAFDYGNTFCEMSINNFCNKYPGFVLDPDLFPSAEQQRTFFSIYLKHLDNPKQLFAEKDQSLDFESMVEKLREFAILGALASHLQWALWGVVQAEHSSIDFGYLEYSLARIDQYNALRRSYEYSKATVNA